MKKPKFPHILTERGVSARIRKLSQVKNGKSYTLFVVDYHLLGKRKREARSTFEEAKQVAKEACRLIAEGRQASLSLTNDDRLTYLRALEALEPQHVSLDLAAREYAECLRLLSGRVSVIEACRDWLRRHVVELPRKTVCEAVSDCLTAQKSDGKSDMRLKQLRIVLTQFAKDIQVQVSDVTTAHVSGWLSALQLAERTKRNRRDVLGFFCRWCVMRGYMSKGTDWMENVQNYSARKLSEIVIFSPGEMTKLLAVAKDMTPFLAIGAFSGVRHAEIKRLDWAQIDLEDGFIEVLAENSKTGERRLVPVHDNLKAWLLPYRQEQGRVVDYENTTKQLLKVAKAAGLTWKHNALRHSFISYRVAETADVPRVADEAGNSTAMIRQHYLRRVRPAQAAEWFAISPPEDITGTAQPATMQQEPQLAAA